MKLSKKSKNSRSRQQKSKKLRKQSRRNQKGGVSNSCTLQYAKSNASYGSGGAATNIHNTNPQASLDLDNKFMSYGGPLPLGSSIVGGGSCKDEGVGTGSPKSETFKEYLTSLDSKLSAVTGGSNYESMIPEPNSKPNTRNSQQRGAGYTSDPSEFIGGQPVYKGYDDNSPPAIVGGQLVFGTPDQPVCGSGAVGGGERRKNKKSNSKKSNSKKSKSKKSKQNKKSKKSKKQRGGDFTVLNRSKPAEFASAFNGEKGVFTADMSQRTFEGRQPNWNPSDV